MLISPQIRKNIVRAAASEITKAMLDEVSTKLPLCVTCLSPRDLFSAFDMEKLTCLIYSSILSIIICSYSTISSGFSA
jgi:hypothetical protein